MARLKLSLLGGFEARLASGTALSLPMKKAQALLAYLGMRPDQSHARDKLAALLWGDRHDEQARGGLRHALVALRRALTGGASASLRIEGQLLALDGARVEVDVVAFERRVAEGNPEALERAAELYRGDLLLGFTVNEPLFEEWLVAERERLREMALDTLARLLAHQTKDASTERGIQTAVRLLGLDPLQESVHRTLMRLYSRQGRRSAALKQYQVCVTALRRELGTEPEAETRKLYQELLRQPLDRTIASTPTRAREAVPPDLPATETALFGRQDELGRLRHALDEARRGHGLVATVIGEAGIGKTRLVSALAADALSLGCRVLLGHCHDSDSILPFGPWVDACRGGKLGTDEEILGALHLARRAELTRLLPEIATAGLPPASESALALFEALTQLIDQIAARQPLVLVLEDLHWADEVSLRMLAFVSRRIRACPTLLIVTAREEELADASMARRTLEDLSRAPDIVPVALSPLTRPDTALLVRALSRVGAEAPAMARVEERIWSMSEGNPFVVMEAMRAFDQDRTGPDVLDDPGRLGLPAGVRDVVARRLDRLSARSQDVVAVAAVIGRRFDFELLQSASAVGERESAAAVEEMVRHRILQTVGNQLDFTHDRIREVAYARLLAPRRRLVHRAVVETLEAAVESRASLDDCIEQLAHHAVRAEVWDKAVRYLRQAGQKAAARSALQEARAWLEQALDVVTLLPDDPATLEEAFEIRFALRFVLSQFGEFRRVLELLREAEALAERMNDEGRRGRVASFMAAVHARLEQPDEGVTSGERALGIAERLGDLRLRVLATTHLALAQYYRGDYARVVELTMANVARLPAEWLYDFFGSTQPVSVNDRFRLMCSLAHLGRFAEAASHEAEVIRLAESTHYPYTVALAYHAASMIHLVKGDWAKARSRIECQIEAIRRGKVVGELPMALAFSARALAYLGEATEARERIHECRQLLDSPAKERLGNGSIYFSLGRAYLLLGQLDEAQRFGDGAIRSISGRVDYVPLMRHLLGDIATHPDRLDPERGATYYRDALAVAESRGMRPLVAQCHHGLGALHRRLGEREPAESHLAIAAAMYREMDMHFWLERITSESSDHA